MTNPGRVSERAVLDLAGLAARARQVVSGTDQVRTALRNRKVRLVVLAADSAVGQQEKLIPLMDALGVRYYRALSRQQLGAAIGRGPVAALGFTQVGFAQRAQQLLDALSLPQDPAQEEV